MKIKETMNKEEVLSIYKYKDIIFEIYRVKDDAEWFEGRSVNEPFFYLDENQ